MAKDLRDEIWNRFKEASTVVRKRHQAHFEAQKAMQEENLAKKEALCEQIENVDMDALKTFADWDRVTKEIIDIQASWKAIGYATQKMNTIVFERFRMACDRFFERKAQFFRQIKDIQNENLAKKKALVERAEALASSTEWKTATDAFVEMQKQWKEIGAVPRKFADSLWKRFIQACDTFFEEKKKALSSANQEQKANLEQKKSLIAQLQELVDGGENNQLIAKANELHAERMLLEVRVDNEPALTLYRHFGFETMGIRKRYYQPENKDAYTMSLTLRDSRPAGFAIPLNTQC